MSFDCENWSDSRGKASEALFKSLSRRGLPLNDLKPPTTTPASKQANVDSNRKRKHDHQADRLPPTATAKKARSTPASDHANTPAPAAAVNVHPSYAAPAKGESVHKTKAEIQEIKAEEHSEKAVLNTHPPVSTASRFASNAHLGGSTHVGYLPPTMSYDQGHAAGYYATMQTLPSGLSTSSHNHPVSSRLADDTEVRTTWTDVRNAYTAAGFDCSGTELRFVGQTGANTHSSPQGVPNHHEAMPYQPAYFPPSYSQTQSGARAGTELHLYGQDVGYNHHWPQGTSTHPGTMPYQPAYYDTSSSQMQNGAEQTGTDPRFQAQNMGSISHWPQETPLHPGTMPYRPDYSAPLSSQMQSSSPSGQNVNYTQRWPHGAALHPSSTQSQPVYSAPPSSQIQSSSPAPVAEKQWHAVKVGWFPGVYESKTEANQQTKNYPLKEQASFTSREAAQHWLTEPSVKASKDAEARPAAYGNLDKTEFLRFVGRAWSKPNQLPGVETKDIMQKLRLLFKQACENLRNDVDWALQPLPQVLVSREKENARNTNIRYKVLGLWSGALRIRRLAAGAHVKQETEVKDEFEEQVKREVKVKTEDVEQVRTRAPPYMPSSPPTASTELLPNGIQRAATTASSVGMVDNKSLPPLPTKCSCKKEVDINDDLVLCANNQCATLVFHKKCVGLSSRKITDGWRCWQCRAKPPASALPPSSSQLRSSPPPMDAIPLSAAPIRQTAFEPEPSLHPEQAHIVDCIARGDNVFYTGSAGTGKSTVLKSFVQKLKAQGKHVDIIAPSGIAALNVGGMTTYAYAGWHPDSFKQPLDELLKNTYKKSVHKRLCATDVLVIDEISMVERDVLVRLDQLMRQARTGWKPEKGQVRRSQHGSTFPFGGVQIVVTGDFCQLPPVRPFKFCMHCGGDELPGHNKQDGRPLTCPRCKKVYLDEEKWAFCSDAWRNCKFTCFELRYIHRQSDKRFIDILQSCRYGKPLSAQDRNLLLAPKPDPLGAVQLLPTRREVDNINLRNFNGLQSAAKAYTCADFFSWKNKEEPELQRKGEPKYPNMKDGPLKALSDHRFEEQIRLKVGMQIILLVNLDFNTGLVNGSQGKIVGWETHADSKVFPPKAPNSPKKPSKRRGSDAELYELRFAQERAQSERELIIEQQIRRFINQNGVAKWPVVQFQNGHTQAIYAHCQLSQLGSEKPYSLLGRTQIPLLAAWAITVHKSQGMTLDRVTVDLYNSFEREMVYVALSRARSLEGLKVVRLAKSLDKGGVNEQVQRFLRSEGIGGKQ